MVFELGTILFECVFSLDRIFLVKLFDEGAFICPVQRLSRLVRFLKGENDTIVTPFL